MNEKKTDMNYALPQNKFFKQNIICDGSRFNLTF